MLSPARAVGIIQPLRNRLSRSTIAEGDATETSSGKEKSYNSYNDIAVLSFILSGAPFRYKCHCPLFGLFGH